MIKGWGTLNITDGAVDPSKLMRDTDLLTQHTLDRLHRRFFFDPDAEADERPEQSDGSERNTTMTNSADTNAANNSASTGRVPKYDYVIIENQPVIKNPTMKTMQVVIYTFFQTMKVLYGVVDHVKFVSAAAKLDTVLPKGQARKLSYSRRRSCRCACAKACCVKHRTYKNHTYKNCAYNNHANATRTGDPAVRVGKTIEIREKIKRSEKIERIKRIYPRK